MTRDNSLTDFSALRGPLGIPIRRWDFRGMWVDGTTRWHDGQQSDAERRVREVQESSKLDGYQRPLAQFTARRWQARPPFCAQVPWARCSASAREAWWLQPKAPSESL